MKPKQSLILMTVTLFLNITGHGWTEDIKIVQVNIFMGVLLDPKFMDFFFEKKHDNMTRF